jgi:hypothetical protein
LIFQDARPRPGYSNDRTSIDERLDTLGEEQAAAWARFYAIEVDSRSGELGYDRALAAAKRLDAAVAEIVAAASFLDFVGRAR